MIMNTKFKNSSDVVSLISSCWLFIILHLTSALSAWYILDSATTTAKQTEKFSHSLLIPSHLCTPLKMEDVNLGMVFSSREYKFHQDPGGAYKTTKPLKHVILQIPTKAM